MECHSEKRSDEKSAVLLLGGFAACPISFVREDDPSVIGRGAVDRPGSRAPRLVLRTGLEVAAGHFSHVFARLTIIGNAAPAIYCAGTSIIRRQGLGKVAIISFEQIAQIRYAGLHVLRRVERIVDAEMLRRFWNQLH